MKKLIKDFFVFYKNNLRKIHIVMFIISVIVFAFSFNMVLNNTDNLKEILKVNNSFNLSKIFSQKILVPFLLIFSGITPFIYIPVLGILFVPYSLALSLGNLIGFNVVFTCIACMIQLFIFSLVISAGIYYTSLSTKRYRYNTAQGNFLYTFKKSYYEIKENKEEIEKIDKKEQEKIDKKNKLNVKIPYKMLIITFAISSIILVILSIVTGV